MYRPTARMLRPSEISWLISSVWQAVSPNETDADQHPEHARVCIYLPEIEKAMCVYIVYLAFVCFETSIRR